VFISKTITLCTDETIADTYGSSAHRSFGGAISNYQFEEDSSSGTLIIYNCTFDGNTAWVSGVRVKEKEFQTIKTTNYYQGRKRLGLFDAG